MDLAVRLLALCAFFNNGFVQGRVLQSPTTPVSTPIASPTSVTPVAPSPVATPVAPSPVAVAPSPVAAPVVTAPSPVIAPVPTPAAPVRVTAPQLSPLSYPISSPSHPSYSVPNIEREFEKEVEDDSLAVGAVIGIVFGILISSCIFITAFCMMRKRGQAEKGTKPAVNGSTTAGQEDGEGGFI